MAKKVTPEEYAAMVARETEEYRRPLTNAEKQARWRARRKAELAALRRNGPHRFNSWFEAYLEERKYTQLLEEALHKAGVALPERPPEPERMTEDEYDRERAGLVT